MHGEFRLWQMIGRIGHAADVAVAVEAADRDEVDVSPDAFAWLRDSYGPRAVIDRPVNDRLVAEAVEGVRYALARLGGPGGYKVTVTKIVDSPVDTADGDVKFAAAHAVCLALGMRLEPPPRLTTNGAVFPS
ncbi:hypothetical protein JOD64_004603 [Micromonospora luteifusca]|uniref:Uncharacterized protein n=1 Tax=Micromonospora luteifusca TaxID=709860 RepID=A0ABS2LYY4_9ACTN|nr:hypothetical protein [Micromonospora luteifusca]MBM7493381.1 hypothetical protein [Micromonospora luteifusca]